MNLSKLLFTYRLVLYTRITLPVKISIPTRCYYKTINLLNNHKYSINDNTRAMSQKSITSFFKATPKKPSEPIKETSQEEAAVKDEPMDVVSQASPIKNGNPKKLSKRNRLSSSGSEAESPTTATEVSSPAANEKKKKVKRKRIVSSESESDDTTKPDVVKTEKTESPKSKTSPKNTTNGLKKKSLDTVKISPASKTKKDTPPPKKTKIKEEKSPLREKNNDKNSSKVNKKNEIKEDIKKDTIDIKKDTKDVKKDIKDVKTEDASKSVVADVDYNPAKAKYDPVKDACWSKGEDVPYLALAKTLEAIEGISARLKIIDVLSNYFRSVIVLTPEDLLPSVYMCLNQLAPAYHSLELGIAETYLMKAIGQSTGRSLAQIKTMVSKEGDLGSVGQQCRTTQRMMFSPPPLKARRVFASLKEIANMTGQASVNKKIAKIQSLYVACRNCEAKYLIRSLEGKLRIGLAEQSVLQALAVATTITPPAVDGTDLVLDASKGVPADEFKARVDKNALIIKTTYCECPNYDMIVPVILREGVAALPAHCRLTPGVPLKPMLAHPTKGVHEVFNRFENEQFTCEWKYDGERAQIHVPCAGEGEEADLSNASIFSRNQENNTSKYPDILRRLPALLKSSVSSCVLDCEAVAYDKQNKQIQPFQVLSTRKRKEAVESEIKVAVCVFVFDLLYLNGEPLVREPLARRRDLLREHFNEVEGEWQFATSKDCTTMEEVQQFLEESVKGSCEGLMVKMLQGENARYDIARRSHNWLKLKKDYLEGVGDTIDAVVIGGYLGKGKRAGALGGFLLACWDPDAEEYQALCKIGTGFSDQDLQNFTKELQEFTIDAPKSYYRFDSGVTADVWFFPGAVWEVRCADLSLSPHYSAARGLLDGDSGMSLRFPRFVRVRTDKTPEQATAAPQLADMYLAQDQVRNQPAKQPADDFY